VKPSTGVCDASQYGIHVIDREDLLIAFTSYRKVEKECVWSKKSINACLIILCMICTYLSNQFSVGSWKRQTWPDTDVDMDMDIYKIHFYMMQQLII